MNYIDVKTFNDTNSITQNAVNMNGSLRRTCTTSMIFDEKFPDLKVSDADGYKKKTSRKGGRNLILGDVLNVW